MPKNAEGPRAVCTEVDCFRPLPPANAQPKSQAERWRPCPEHSRTCPPHYSTDPACNRLGSGSPRFFDFFCASLCISSSPRPRFCTIAFAHASAYCQLRRPPWLTFSVHIQPLQFNPSIRRVSSRSPFNTNLFLFIVPPLVSPGLVSPERVKTLQ